MLVTVSARGTAVTATIVGGSGGTRAASNVTAGVRTGVRYGDGDAKDEDVVTRMSRGVAGRREVGGWIGWWVVMR